MYKNNNTGQWLKEKSDIEQQHIINDAVAKFKQFNINVNINDMWILKNSKDLLDNLKSRSFSQVSSIKTSDFSTLYTTLQHDKLKTRLKETIHKAFSHGNYGSN
jgi:regulation of enolase protein 1 (concanavalin A-like superfamily)